MSSDELEEEILQLKEQLRDKTNNYPPLIKGWKQRSSDCRRQWQQDTDTTTRLQQVARQQEEERKLCFSMREEHNQYRQLDSNSIDATMTLDQGQENRELLVPFTCTAYLIPGISPKQRSWRCIFSTLSTPDTMPWQMTN